MNNFTYLKNKDFSTGRNYLGASDVPTIALLNLKYGQTPLTLWETLTGRREQWKGNSRTAMGHELEHVALKKALEKLEYSKDEINAFLISRIKNKNKSGSLVSWTEFKHPDLPFLVVHPDLIDIDKEFNIEAKSHGFFGGQRKDDLNVGYDKDDMSANGIPSSTYLQVQTQSLCTGFDDNYVSSLIDNIPYLYGSIKPHIKTQEKIMAIVEKFWWHVEKDTPPKPETWKDVVSLNPNLDKESKTVIAGDTLDEVLQMKASKKEIDKKIKKLEADKKDIKNAIGLLLGENAILESPEGEGLAKSFDVTRYSLKNYKDMSKRRFNQLVKDGFISETKYRDMRY